ncbi:hypothetical protein SPIRO4BDMA_20015 [uncultured spirochete]|uniref:Uncharacterized protein n=1 Tax=uncultured spirochete TaxID=156406 RepID=A0A3P3XM58_9SPIR|nr:hypothetical protein SPIRO4BDMA_10012 [uncultured spirochete]SLM17354.1 hypothetical protein SPIRO4BDMA_20008 [uncultured spirochete]SLM17361.1 hypothetical protein SPIRO4BDMA_20015 [uncultured spirochete]
MYQLFIKWLSRMSMTNITCA